MDPTQTPHPRPRHAAFDLTAHSGSIGAARELTRSFFRGRRPPVPEQLVTDTLLTVSELVTNAVRHAPGPCTLDLDWDGEQVTVAVGDTSDTRPRLRTPDLTAGTGGFGLHLLRSLGGRVRTLPRPGGGKIIAITLPRALLAL